MQNAGYRERERINRRVKIYAVIRFHSVQALHRTDWRFKNGTGRVTKFLAGVKV